jgi:hypothetical protein
MCRRNLEKGIKDKRRKKSQTRNTLSLFQRCHLSSPFSLEGVLKLFLIFSPAKPRSLPFFEQKKPMKVKNKKALRG